MRNLFRSTRRGALGVVVAAVLVATGLVSCADERWVSAPDDQVVCIYSQSEKNRGALIDQILPGDEAKKFKKNVEVVYVPTSARFWSVQSTGSRDPGAPTHYAGNGLLGARIFVEGQIHFRFNKARACEWYALHGRRNLGGNPDLGFNCRGDEATCAAQGWFKFGNEKFVTTMQDVVSYTITPYAWDLQHFNYPENADPETGKVPDGEEPGVPARQALGDQLGARYTTRITDILNATADPDDIKKGGFFCGVGAGSAEDNFCPGIAFQVTYAGPCSKDPSLPDYECEDAKVKARERLQDVEAEIAAQEAEGELIRARAETVLADEEAKQKILAAEAATADAQARKDLARCLVIIATNPNLDCEGKHPPVVAPSVGG